MAMPSSIKAYSLADPTRASEVIQQVLEQLRQPTYFRTALAFYRRLQFGRFLNSSYLFTNRQWNTQPGQTDTPWFYAFVDRGCRPETEVWLFGSWEVETHRESDTTHGSQNNIAPEDQTIRTLLLDFINSIKTIETPPSIHRPEDVLAAQTQLAPANHYHTKPPTPQLPDPNIMLFGAIHATTVPHLQSLNLLALHLLPLIPNHTFLFPLSTLPTPKPLPPNLRWGKLSQEHFPLVRSRTEIARQDFTLARLPNLAIFPVEPADSPPVAWAFVGLDGSLTTLHTEAEFRRLGLGMALTAKLFKEEIGGFWEYGVERLAHGNVMVGNEASAAMCRNLGGRSANEVYWIRVDLGA